MDFFDILLKQRQSLGFINNKNNDKYGHTKIINGVLCYTLRAKMAENKMMLKGLFMFWSQREKFYAAKQRHSPIRKNNDDFASNNNWIEGRIGLFK